MPKPHQACPCLALALCAVFAPASAAADWTGPFAETDVIQVVTLDADGDVRDTAVWVVVLEDAAFVRTNASRWLANIRRGSPVDLRTDAVSQPVRAEEIEDPGLAARVEEAFKAKYGWFQRVMSALRIREPTVLRLTPSGRDLPVGALEE